MGIPLRSHPSPQRISALRRRLGCLLVIALVLTLGRGALPSHAATGWHFYTHPTYGFSMSYPDGWTLKRSESSVIVMMAVGPKSAGQPEFRMNVNVVVDSVPADTSIEEFDTVANAKLQQIFPGYQLLRSDRTQLGGLPAVVRYITWHARNVELYQLQLGLIVGTRLYVVTGTTLAASGRLKDEALLLQQILVTFRP